MAVSDSTDTVFLLFRHGQTLENVQKLMQGQQDTQLDETGKQQAKDLAETVSHRFPHIDQIYSSPLRRALETATIVAEKTHSTVIQEKSFTEICWGVAEGVPIKELDPLVTEDYALALKNPHDFTREEKWKIPYFENAESYHDVLERVQAQLTLIADSSPGKTIAIFTHSRVIQILIGACENSDEDVPLHNGAVARFNYNSQANRLQFQAVDQLITANH